MLSRSTLDRLGLTLLTFGLIAVAIFLPWRTFITNILIVSSSVIWFLNLRHNGRYFVHPTRLFIILLIGPYLVELTGMIYTENITYGLHRLESKLSILAFPVIILGSSIKKEHIDRILLAFVASTVIACVFCTARVVISVIRAGQPIDALWKDKTYSHLYLTEPLQQIHPTFLTLFICLAIYVITEYARTKPGRYWLYLVDIFLVYFAFQLASRAGYVAMACTLIFSGYAFIGMKRKAMLIIYSSLIVVGFLATVSLVPTIRTRLVEDVFRADIHEEQVNSVTYHLRSWTCSIETWLDGHIIFGYGTGDEVDTLSKCYESKNWLDYRHDAHNEFLSSLVKHGLFGFLVLVVSFFFPYFLALKYRDLRYFTFLTIVLLCFLSESMLRGQTGLIFYTLFNALFLKDLLIRQNLIPEDTLVGMTTA